MAIAYHTSLMLLGDNCETQQIQSLDRCRDREIDTDKFLFLQPATTQDLFGYWIIQAPYSHILRYKGLIAYLTNA